MHSDETWLSGLSRHILVTGDFSVTEPFFDLKPRHPHALKIIFHSLQILIIKAFGYSLFNVRLLSLIFGLTTLYFFYRLGLMVLPAKKWALWACFLMGIDLQFIYASHFGRQEIVLLWAMVFGMYYYFKSLDAHHYRQDLVLGALAGLSIGIHPNSLIMMLVFSGIYLTHVFKKRIKFRSFLIFSSTIILLAFCFIILSYRFDPNFLANYFAYGQEQFKILNPFSARLSRLADFTKAIYLRQGGTYYLPDFKMAFLLLTATFLLGLTTSGRNRGIERSLAPSWLISSIIAIIVGLVVIGRYNITSIVLFTPMVYLLIGLSLAKIPEQFGKTIPPLLALALISCTVLNIGPFLKYDYQSYLRKVAAAVDPDRKVLASLNVEYTFNDGCLYDLRNLSFLRRQGFTIEEYLRKNQIEYLIYPEGLDFIYRTRPRWNGVYGHLPYYRELRQFLRENCRRVTSFNAPAYGIEIPAYVGEKNWRIAIYRVLP